MRTFYFRNRDSLTIVTLHRIASAGTPAHFSQTGRAIGMLCFR
jgi:hypothetical protein